MEKATKGKTKANGIMIELPIKRPRFHYEERYNERIDAIRVSIKAVYRNEIREANPIIF